MTRKPQLTKAGTPRKRKPGAGRPSGSTDAATAFHSTCTVSATVGPVAPASSGFEMVQVTNWGWFASVSEQLPAPPATEPSMKITPFGSRSVTCTGLSVRPPVLAGVRS